VLMMASYYTRSKVPRTSELVTSECSDVEPSDAAPSAAATSPLPLSITVRPSAAAAGEFGSMSTEPAEPVSAPIHPLPAGGPSSLGGRGVLGPAGSPQVGVSTLGYPSGQAGPTEIGTCSDVQVSPYSLATGIAESRAQLEASFSSRQPPAATETAAAQGLTLSPQTAQRLDMTASIHARCKA